MKFKPIDDIKPGEAIVGTYNPKTGKVEYRDMTREEILQNRKEIDEKIQ